MVPIVAGLLMGAAVGGGIAALQKRDIAQGALMGGIGGALGGAFMPGASAAGMGAGEAVASTAGTLGSEFGVQGALSGINALPAAAEGAVASAIPVAAPAAIPAVPLDGVAQVTPGVVNPGSTVQSQVASAMAPAPTLTTVTPTPKPFEIGNFLSDNKYALAGGVLGGMMAPGEKPKDTSEGEIRPYTYSQTRNPLFGQPGQPYFTQTYTPGEVTSAAGGGIIALADGGRPQDYRVEAFKPVPVQDFSAVRAVSPAVQAYNQQLMDRANQQYNLNPRPAALQIPTMPAAAPVVDPGFVMLPNAPSAGNAGIGGFRFDPMTKRYIGDTTGATKEKTELEKMREELDTMRMNMPSYEVGGGAAGGLTKSYAMGGDIGARYQSPDDMGMGDRVGAHQTVNMAPHYPMQGMYQGYAEGGISHLGDYSDGGRLLKGPGDGVSDDIPAQIGDRQPARLADGEFVVPARIVSELGNGSTDAGAKRLYAMMDRVQKARKKSVGKDKVAVDSKASQHLPV